MLTLTKSLFSLMIGFIGATMCGLILVPFLKKIKLGQRISIYVGESHKKKEGTPTMGGIIFLVPTIVTVMALLIFDKIEYSPGLGIILFVLTGYAIIGAVDDIISIKNKSNKGLTEIQKLFLQFVVALGFFFLFREAGGRSSLTITLFNFNWDMGWFYGVFILFLLVGVSNAVNITDGLDGLAGGLAAISFLAFGLIAWGTKGILGNDAIAIFCFVMTGSLMGFLLFNTHPAKIFMGDIGSLSLGAVLATIAILTSHELSLILICGVFFIETLVDVIQIISVKYFHKKIFLMAPLHHHFEKLGWTEQDIVKLFWTVGLILCLMALIYGVWL